MYTFGQNNQFYIKIYRNQKTFFKISPPPPPCASKNIGLYMCYHILHIVWNGLAGTRGERCPVLFTPSFANVLYLSICMLGNCSCFYFRLLTFFKIRFLQINHSGSSTECQIVWIQIRTDVLLVFIWVPTVCKKAIGRRQNSPLACKELQ